MTYTWPIWTHAGADAVGLEETSVDDPDDELWMCCRVIIFYYLSCKQASCVWFIFVAKWQERQMSWDWHLSLSSLSLTTFRSHRVHTARWSIHVTQGSIRMSMCIIYQYIRSDMYQISVRNCTRSIVYSILKKARRPKLLRLYPTLYMPRYTNI